MTVATTAGAELLIENMARASRHAAAERSRDVDVVMATITAPEDLTWAGTLCWSVNDPMPDGSTHLRIKTTLDEVRAFYIEWRETEIAVGTGHMLQNLRSPWYTFTDVIGTPVQNHATGKVKSVDTLVLFMTDGQDGISSEIAWRRCEDVSLDVAERGERWLSFLAALRRQDVAALLASMSPSVQGAVREYFDAVPAFVAIRGREAMRAHYEKLFAHAEILDIQPVMVSVGDWFVFSELRWVVRLTSGTDRGREVRFLTAEHMPFDAEGLFMARCGYGTEMQ